MQIKRAVGGIVLGVALSAASVPASTVGQEAAPYLMQHCLTQAGFYRGALTGENDQATKQAFLEYIIARRGKEAVKKAAMQGIAAVKVLGSAAGEQLMQECIATENTLFDDLEQSMKPVTKTWWPFYRQ